MDVPNIPIHKVQYRDLQTAPPSRMMDVRLLPKFHRSLKQYENKLIRLAGKECWLIPTVTGPGYVLAERDPRNEVGEGGYGVRVANAGIIGTATVFHPRIYMDTSVVNHLVKTKRPEWQEATRALWREIIDEDYPVRLSQTFFEELDRCYEPKRGEMYRRMGEIGYAVYGNTQEVKELAKTYLSRANLDREECLEDALHIANAVVNKCNVLLSWNFRHMVNASLVPKFNEANHELGYNEIDMLSPLTFLRGATTC